MPKYDSAHFDPPAPLALVGLRHVNGGIVVNDVPMLLDTGADITLVPRNAIEQLGMKSLQGVRYEMQGVDGVRSSADAVEVDVIFLNKIFRGICLLIDDEQAILGRDVLAGLVLLLDGPQQEWSQLKT